MSVKEPKGFTDQQREVFRAVADLIRGAPAGFTAAGRWLDTCQSSGVQSSLPDFIPADPAASLPDFIPATPPTPPGLTGPHPESPAAPAAPAPDAETSSSEFHDIIETAARELLSDPPNYDSLRPDLVDLRARCVLLVAWILTDTRPLTTAPSVTKLQAWEWGAHQHEFLDGVWPDGKGKPLPRLFARALLLDSDLEQWEALAREALRVLQPAPPAQPAEVQPGEWLIPMSLTEMAIRLSNMTPRKAKKFLTQYGLHRAGNRQLWTVRLDLMPVNLRRQLEAK